MKYFTIFALLLVIFVAYTSAQRCPGAPRHTGCRNFRDAGRRGPGCRPRLMWYYDLRRRQCLSLRYLGCGGNTNRFCTLSHCRQRCRG